jgi:multiple sugar transport system substrate-binding protein
MKCRAFIFFLIAALLLCAGCSSMGKKEEMPTTITVWHVYGGQTDSPLNDLIEQFNQTVGKDRQINVQVTSVSNTNTIHELVLAAANGEPGAPELPDLFVSYPKTVMALPDDSILVDYQDYFSEEELSAFRISWKRGSSTTAWSSSPWQNPRRSCISTRPSLTASLRLPA